MRVVLDTNVVVSAFLRGGKPGRMIDFARTGSVELFTSSALVAELADVIYRRKFTKTLAEIDLTPSELLERYVKLALAVEPYPVGRTVSDADDDVVLGTAKAAQADLLVSGDRHLLTVGGFEGITILTVADALLRIEAAEPAP